MVLPWAPHAHGGFAGTLGAELCADFAQTHARHVPYGTQYVRWRAAPPLDLHAGCDLLDETDGYPWATAEERRAAGEA